MFQLLQPKYASYISPEQRVEIIRIVERAVEFQNSHDIGVDDRHGPRLYARFIGGLLERVKTPPAKSTRSSRSRRRNPEISTTEHQITLSPLAVQPPPINYFEPLPAQSTTPFDHFAFPTDIDPLACVGGGSALGLTASEFFYAPLPFDSDLLESMQSLSSLPEMSDAMLPGMDAYTQPKFSDRPDAAPFSGFGWMKQMPPSNFDQYQQQMIGAYYS
jgi:hypothetical protein